MSGIKGQGGLLSVGSAVSGTALAISAATAANPVVLTTATNTYAAGDIIVVTGLVGPANLNDRAFVAASPTSTTVGLKGEDGTANTAYVSGGTTQKWTMVQVSQGTDIQGFDGQSSEIDITHLQSQAKQYVPGLQDFGQVTMTILTLAGDAGSARLRACRAQQLTVPFSLTLSDGTVSAFMGFVKQFTLEGVKPDGAIQNKVVIRITNAPAWLA